MPWHIETDNAACDGFAVVKDGTAEVEGCHRTRGQAERQIAALYASEPEARQLEDDLEDEPEDDRVVITDIDDTIVRAGVNPIRETIDEINGYGVDVYVLTGRDPGQRPATERLLADIGLRYEELYMVGSQAAKREAINEIAAEHEVIAAYENDPTVRGFYETAGIPVKGGRTRRQQVEEILAQLRAAR